jgi:hypothetical protein
VWSSNANAHPTAVNKRAHHASDPTGSLARLRTSIDIEAAIISPSTLTGNT